VLAACIIRANTHKIRDQLLDLDVDRRSVFLNWRLLKQTLEELAKDVWIQMARNRIFCTLINLSKQAKDFQPTWSSIKKETASWSYSRIFFMYSEDADSMLLLRLLGLIIQYTTIWKVSLFIIQHTTIWKVRLFTISKNTRTEYYTCCVYYCVNYGESRQQSCLRILFPCNKTATGMCST
jgi:hypothetical protein